MEDEQATAIIIYGLLDPADGVIRYVGRTKQRPNIRLNQHMDIARRSKFNNPRVEWIREVIKSGRQPKIKILELTCKENQVSKEREWINKLPNLVNTGDAAQGGDKSYKVKWTNDLDSLLGVLSDSEIAEMIGVTRKSVSYRRAVLGVKASFSKKRMKPPPAMGGHNRKILPENILIQIGTMPDYKLAEIAGVSKAVIASIRHKRNIRSFSEITGNTGRYEKGNYPKRWTHKK